MIEMITIIKISEGYSYTVNGLLDTNTELITTDAVDLDSDLTEAEWTNNYWINDDGTYGMEG